MTKRRDYIKKSALIAAGITIGGVGVKAHSYSSIIDTSNRINKGKKNKIGQTGVCHEHASGKINALRKMPDIFDIVGIVDDRNFTGAKRAGGDRKPYEELIWMTEKELFNTLGLQAVVIGTPNSDLVLNAIRCMEYNLAMHMDKPAGEDLELFGKMLNG
jgi:hypothetical protein